MLQKTIIFAKQIASLGRSTRRSRSRTNSNQYQTLERRQVLTSFALPAITTNLDTFASVTEDAVVRVNDNSELVIRLTGEENNVEINLELGLIRVNSTDQEPVLGIDTDAYDRILVLGDGVEDSLVVIGDDLRAQLHPTRTWIFDEDYARADDQEITVQGLNLESVEIENFQIPFVTEAVGGNTVRLFGNDGDDHLTMTGSQSATFVGDNYEHRISGVDRLFVNANGGVNFAGIIGTRAIQGLDANAEDGTSDWHCADSDDGTRTCFPYQVGDGVDLFYARDDFASLQNDQIQARFSGFGTTRVDLLSGQDQVHVEDTEAASSRYRVDGETLVGSNRRYINAEQILIDGAEIDRDQIVIPDFSAENFTNEGDDYRFAFQRDTSVALSEEDELYEDLNEVVPVNFTWRFTSFEETI